MNGETRTSAQLRGAIIAAAKLARYLDTKPMPTPRDRHLANELHLNINRELDVLEERGDLTETL